MFQGEPPSMGWSSPPPPARPSIDTPLELIARFILAVVFVALVAFGASVMLARVEKSEHLWLYFSIGMLAFAAAAWALYRAGRGRW